MPSNALNSVCVTEKDLRKHLGNAQALLQEVTMRVPVVQASRGTFISSGSTVAEKMGILQMIKDIDPEDAIGSHVRWRVIRALCRGIQMAYYMSREYRKRSGVENFDTARGATTDQNTVFNEKMQTAAAIAQFSFARYVLWDLRTLIEKNSLAGNITVTANEINLTQPTKALECLLFYLGKNIHQFVERSDDRLLVIVEEYIESLQQEILNRKEALKYTEFFVDVTYQLEETEFSIAGFALVDLINARSVEFNRVDFGQIAGNRDAKRFLYMDAKRRLCYDLTAQKNPFLELGGLTPVFMGCGIPGTGKSMFIAAYATMLSDMCASIGLPFLFHPLPDNIVDPYQGNSARNMLNWIKVLQDPKRIIWAPIDDAENILENRLHQGVSEGVKAAIGIFLRYTEGAYAISRGNGAIGVFTNLPENLDPAVLSRIQARFMIDGARKIGDFLYQDFLWWEKIAKSDPEFVQMTTPHGYQWGEDQGVASSMGEISDGLMIPQEVRIRDIFDRVLTKASPDSHQFFAELYMAVQAEYKYFSSRDVRNIQSAVNLRIMDFDLPDEWFTGERSVFVEKVYEEKLQMILELRKANMKGLSFADIRLQEANRYLDNMARIADAEFQRNVEAGVRQMRERLAVEKAVQEKIIN
jgi:hypothetical protein